MACGLGGDVRADELHGLFVADTRVLSSYRIMLAGQQWQLVGQESGRAWHRHVDFSKPVDTDSPGRVRGRIVVLEAAPSGVGRVARRSHDQRVRVREDRDPIDRAAGLGLRRHLRGQGSSTAAEARRRADVRGRTVDAALRASGFSSGVARRIFHVRCRARSRSSSSALRSSST